MRWVLIFSLMFVAAQTAAKDKKEKISIQVVDSASEAVVSGHVPGTNAYSSTSCGSSGTTNVYETATDSGGGTTNVSGMGNSHASTNCQTVYHEATPGHDTYVTHVAMYATIPALKKDVLLWCAVQWRQCEALPQGTYDAEMKDDVVWIYTFGGPRASKIKYRIVNPALFGLKDNLETSSKPGDVESSSEGCSARDSKKECQDVMDCVRGGGTQNYCEMMHGEPEEHTTTAK